MILKKAMPTSLHQPLTGATFSLYWPVRGMRPRTGSRQKDVNRIGKADMEERRRWARGRLKPSRRVWFVAFKPISPFPAPSKENPVSREYSQRKELAVPEKKTDHIGEFRTIPGNPPTWCRVRIYETESKPLILLSSVEENRGPSLANTVEFVSTEVVVEYLPHLTRSSPSVIELLRERRGLEVPFTVIECFSMGSLRQDLERLAFVEFSDAMVRHLGRGVRRLGSFRYKEASREEVERLIGEPM